MADIALGDIVARLRLDATQLQQGMQQAQQALAEFQRQQQRSIAGSQQVSQATRQAMQEQAIAARQAAQESSQAFRTAYQQTGIAAQQAAQQARQAAQASSQAFRTAYQQTAIAAREASEASRQAFQQQMQEARQAAQATRSAWSNVFQVAGGIGLATSLGEFVSMLRRVGSEMVQVGARFELLRASLSALGSSTANGARQFQFLVDTAQRLGVAFEPLAQGWRRFTAAASQTTLALTDQQRLFTALSTEARRVGTSNDELSRALAALAQVASKGTLSMEELRGQLGEALPTAIAATAQGMGRTTEELIKLVETGTVRFVPFAQALTRGLEQMNKGTEQLGATATAAFNRMTTEFKLLADAIMQSGLNQYLVTILGNFQEAARFLREGFFRQPTVAPVGPNLGELGVSQENQRRLMQLDATIARTREQLALAERAGPRGEGPANERLELARRTLQVLEDQRTQILESAKATQANADAEAKAAEATNRTTAAREHQAAFNRDFATGLEAVQKAQRQFREEAALAPQLRGDPRGDPDEVQEYYRNERKAIDDSYEALVKLANERVKGVQLTAEQRQALATLNQEYGRLNKSIDDSKEAEKERQKAAREAQRDAEHALTLVTQTQALLERSRAAIARPTSTAAEEARARVQEQEAALRGQLLRAQEDLQRSAAARGKAPQLLPQLQEQLEQIGPAFQNQAQQAFDAKLLQEFLTPLQRIEESYRNIRANQDLIDARKFAANLAGTEFEAQANEMVRFIEGMVRLQNLLPTLEAEARDSAEAFRQVQEAMQFDQRLEQTLERLRAPREERESLRARQALARERLPLTEERRALLERIEAQERLNTSLRLFEGLANDIGNAWVQTLEGIASGTRSVSEAFQAMAKSILQSISQIASQEAFRALIRIGAGLITSAFAGGGIATAGGNYGGLAQGFNSASLPYDFGFQGLQSGGVITRPTLALMGEGPPHTLPETVLNRGQMQSLLTNASRANKNADVTIINVANRAQAEEEAARERSMGRQVIINEVLNDLRQGSGSQIGRLMRVSQQ